MRVDLLVHAPEIVRGIDPELTLVRRVRRQRVHVALVVDVAPLTGADPTQVGNLVHQQAEHVIERAVLHHEHDDVLDARMAAAVVRPRGAWPAADTDRGCGGSASDHRQPLSASGRLPHAQRAPVDTMLVRSATRTARQGFGWSVAARSILRGSPAPYPVKPPFTGMVDNP